jgi:phosphatidylglycerophosphate synthase
MIDNYFRSQLPKFISPIVRFFAAIGMTPNMVTLLGFLVALASAYFTSQGMFLVALGTWWVSRLLDGMDGILARHLDLSSEFGAYLDILLDMFAYSLMVVAFISVFPEQTTIWNWILLLYVLCITSALAFGNMEQKLGSVGADSRKLRLGAGLAEAGETGIAYSIFLVFPTYIYYSSRIWLIILIVTVLSRSLMAYSLHKRAIK